MSIAVTSLPPRPAAAMKRPLQPLDMLFFAITSLIPIETLLQASFGASMAFGRFITPAFILAYLALRPPAAIFRLPPGILLIAPWFAVALTHIALQGEWFGIYNYRTYVLNSILCVAAYNYVMSNRPSAWAVLFSMYSGVVLLGLWLIATGQASSFDRGRLSIFGIDENHLGSIYGLAVVIAVILASRTDTRWPMKILLFAGAVPSAVLMLATGSRGALLSVLLGVFAQALYVAIFRRRGGFLIGLLVLGSALGVGKSIYDQSQVIKDRVASMTAESGTSYRFGYRDVLFFNAMDMLSQSPFVGWGEKAAWDELARRTMINRDGHIGTHNTYLLVLLTSGVFAGGAFVWWMVRPMIPQRKLLVDQDFAGLYVVMIFIQGTFLTLDQLAHRDWWWLFPIFLGQAAMTRIAVTRGSFIRPRQAPATIQPQTL